jgi:hypothetical protein
MKGTRYIGLLLTLTIAGFGATMFLAMRGSDANAGSEPRITAGPDWRKMKPIALIYNSGTGELSAEVYAVEKAHHFPNGKTEEGWFVRPIDVPNATPIWTVKPHKAKVMFQHANQN